MHEYPAFPLFHVHAPSAAFFNHLFVVCWDSQMGQVGRARLQITILIKDLI